MRRRVVIADDHAIVVQGLRGLLGTDPDLHIAGVAHDGPTLEALLETARADLLILDLHMPKLDFEAAIPAFKIRFPQMRILVLTGTGRLGHAHRTLAVGADGFVLKDDDTDKLFAAVRVVLDGDRYLDPALAASESGGPGASPLSTRETQVLRLIGQGLANPEIAVQLGLSVGTVRKHRENLMRKLDLHNTAQLTTAAVRLGLIE
ncbi:MAG: response regulator transcription factor [Burkholderiales bacterium]